MSFSGDFKVKQFTLIEQFKIKDMRALGSFIITLETIKLHRGKTAPILIELVDENNAVANLHGVEAFLALKTNINDTDNLVEKPILLTHPMTVLEDGKFVIQLDPADTAGLDPKKYVYDIQVAGPNSEVTNFTMPNVASFTTGAVPADYLTFSSAKNATAYYAYFDPDGLVTDPAPGGTGIAVDIQGLTTEAEVAQALADALAPITDVHVTYTAGDDNLTITNTASGATTNATAGTSSAAVLVVRDGADTYKLQSIQNGDLLLIPSVNQTIPAP